MATTTTNYGFDVPTSSDLVKNGATAISTLGQDLDTFLFRPFTQNGILNSSFNVWQRGTSISVTASTAPYTADRWQVSVGANQASTVSRQATGDTTNLPNIQYAARVQRNSGQTGTQSMLFVQSFETTNSIPFAGKAVTISFYARKGADYSPASSLFNVALISGTGTDQNRVSGAYTGNANVISNSLTLTTSWQRFTFTGTVGATATELAAYFFSTPTGTASTNDYFEITGIQLEVGNQMSPYTPATPTYATELAACQRYYFRYTPDAAATRVLSTGQCVSTTVGAIAYKYPVTMRTRPTALEQSGTASNYGLLNATGTTVTCSAVPTYDSGTTSEFGWSLFTVASGLIAGNATVAIASTTSSYLGWSAEL
jgi:hypothetical protein